MTIKKNVVIFFLTVNVIILFIGIFKFFYLHRTFINDTDLLENVAPLLNGRLSYITDLLNYIVLLGLLYTLNCSKESIWVKSGILTFFLWRLLIQFSFYYIIRPDRFSPPHPNFLLLAISVYADLAINVFMLITFFFVKNKQVKGYFLVYAIAMGLIYLFDEIGPALHDDLGFTWAWINKEMCEYITYFITLALFINLLKSADKRRNSAQA